MLPTKTAAGLIIFTEREVGTTQPGTCASAAITQSEASERVPHAFLLLQHKDRWDLPKGHSEPGESSLETAIRETEEETGLSRTNLHIDSGFQFHIDYEVDSDRFGKHKKSVTYFLAFLASQQPLTLTEHIGHQWFPWPSSPIQKQTIDPLLNAVAVYFASK